MRTLKVIGLWEVMQRAIRFAGVPMPYPGERIHLIVAAGVMSYVVQVESVGEQGYALGRMEASCRGANLSLAVRLHGSKSSSVLDTKDDD